MTETLLPTLASAGLSRRQLHFVFVVDASGSMHGERIASLNYAVRAAIPAMLEAASGNTEVEILVRVLRFSDGVDWLYAGPVPVRSFQWTDIQAGGDTNMGVAFMALAEAMSSKAMPGRQVAPVVVLMSDGLPTDDFEAGLAAFLSSDYGAKAVRIAIAIGADADLALLQEFIAQPLVKPLQAHNAEALVNRIKWAASVPVRSVSSPVGGVDAVHELAQGVTDENAEMGDLVW